MFFWVVYLIYVFPVSFCGFVPHLCFILNGGIQNKRWTFRISFLLSRLCTYVMAFISHLFFRLPSWNHHPFTIWFRQKTGTSLLCPERRGAAQTCRRSKGINRRGVWDGTNTYWVWEAFISFMHILRIFISYGNKGQHNLSFFPKPKSTHFSVEVWENFPKFPLGI